MLAEQLEAGQIDEHVLEQIRALEQHARELGHDLAGALDPGRGQEGQIAAEPAGREHRAFVVDGLAPGQVEESGVPDVRVDDGDGRAGQGLQREAELDQHRRNGYLVIGGNEADHAELVVVQLPSNAGAGRPHVAVAITTDRDADAGEQRVVVRVGHAGSLCANRSDVYSIVHVLSSYGVGGQERVALDLAIGQQARGHRVGVVSLAPPPDGAMAKEFSDAGIEVGRVEKRGGLDPTLIPRLARELRARRADIVHTHNPLPLIYGAPAARLIGAAAIHTKHGINPGGRAHMLLRRAAAQLAHAFVAVSDTTAAQARKQHDMPEGRLHTIPNGIRLERYQPDAEARAAARVELGLGDAWVVGSVGRLDDYKNQALLVRAMAPLLSSSVRLVIVGDGPSRAALEAEVARLPEPRWVVLTGRRMDVPALMPAFDVFALSSKTEGLPLVVPEAMSAGLPVIATAVGGLPSVIDEGHTGMLVPVDESALRAALKKLADDHELARELGRHARTAALARYSSERMVDAYLDLYAAAR